jgi:hypothetical protein
VKFVVHYWPRGTSQVVYAGTKEMPEPPYIGQIFTHEIDGMTRRVKVMQVTRGTGTGHYPGDNLAGVYVADA